MVLLEVTGDSETFRAPESLQVGRVYYHLRRYRIDEEAAEKMERDEFELLRVIQHTFTTTSRVKLLALHEDGRHAQVQLVDFPGKDVMIVPADSLWAR